MNAGMPQSSSTAGPYPLLERLRGCAPSWIEKTARPSVWRCPIGHAVSCRDPIADLADKRDDAAVVGELQAAPAPAQPIGREHRFALEADKRPAVTRGNQPQLAEATHSIADAFERAASTPHTTVNQGKSSHGRSFARGHKKATRPTREFGKSSRRPAHLNPSPAVASASPLPARPTRRAGPRSRPRSGRHGLAARRPIGKDWRTFATPRVFHDIE